MKKRPPIHPSYRVCPLCFHCLRCFAAGKIRAERRGIPERIDDGGMADFVRDLRQDFEYRAADDPQLQEAG